MGSLVRLDSSRLAVVVEQSESGLLYPIVRVVFDIYRNRKVTPFDMDLSKPESAGDRVVAHEQPERWNLNPYDFLTLDLKQL